MSILPHDTPPCRCEECGNSFYWSRKNRNRFCSRSCYLANLDRTHLRYERHCQYCGAPFTTKRSEQIFCTHKCSTDYDSQVGRATVYCDGCGGLVTKHRSAIAVTDYTFCCAECRAEWRGRKVSTTCRGCGVVFKNPMGKTQRRSFCTQKCYQTWLHARTASKLEQRVGAALSARGMILVPQYPLHGFIYDFADENSRVLIEVDGTYWHSLAHAINRDRAKDIVAYRQGWRLIRIPEADLTVDWDGTINKVFTGALDVGKPSTRHT